MAFHNISFAAIEAFAAASPFDATFRRQRYAGVYGARVA